jgi:hypothetical protein
MKSLLHLFLTTILIATPCLTWAEASDTQTLQTDARRLSKALGQQLKSTLVAAMKSGGPEQAITVCNIQAPVIADQVSQEANWLVGRTALKIRNPDNAPDEWERAVLQAFEQRITSGEPVQNLEFAEVVEDQGQRVFRYMKAIPTAKPCLSCHGETLSKPVRQQLDTLYPDDQATGFRLNDLRGAFTLRKPL